MKRIITQLAGGKLPDGVTIDGKSFAPTLRGEVGTPREWIFVQLGRNWYARGSNWKLDQAGQLTREQYLAKQPDPGKGAKRFAKLDTNKDNVLTRDEFTTAS